MYDIDRHDYFRRFIYHKQNQDYSIREIMHSMELDELLSDLIAINPEDILTDRNSDLLRNYIEANWEKVGNVYGSQIRAAGRYYKNLLPQGGKAAAIDIGWAGSGAMSLYRLEKEVWKLGCDIRGIVAGTNTIYNAEPDAAEPFLQSGRMVAYLYSQAHNRDLLKKHDPDKGYNVFWELLLSSDTPQFVGFYEGDVKKGTDDIYDSALDITLRFGMRDVNPDGARDIQRGILDFVEQYKKHFEQYPYMFNVSGRDAYAPLLAVTGKNEKYLHAIESKFEMEINVI